MLTIENVSNPIWADANKTTVLLTVKFAEFADAMQFGANSFDPEPHGIELYNNAISGQYGEIAQYIEPEKPIKPITT